MTAYSLWRINNMKKYIYVATVGRKYKVDSFEGSVQLRLDHKDILKGDVYYVSENKLIIETTLSYDVGQKVSIGGYPIGGKRFTLEELSITNNPVLEGAEIIEKEVIE